MNTVRATRGVARATAVPVPSRPRRPVRRPELRVVEGEGQPVRRRLVPVIVVMAGIIFFCSLLGLAVFHTFLVQSQSTLDELDDQIIDARAASEDLRLAVAQLGAPDRILAMALESLGLVEPTDVVMLHPQDTDAATALPGPPDPSADDQGEVVTEP